jgi:antitoxin HicB
MLAVEDAWNMRYTIVLDPDLEDGGYTVTVPALPGVVTEGDTVKEGRQRAIEAIGLHIEGPLADGEPVSEESARRQVLTVDVA